MVCARLHIICGNCGCNDQMEYEIDPAGSCDDEGKDVPHVYITCKNCSTIHDLSETIKESSTQ